MRPNLGGDHPGDEGATTSLQGKRLLLSGLGTVVGSENVAVMKADEELDTPNGLQTASETTGRCPSRTSLNVLITAGCHPMDLASLGAHP